jgi:hypothetical protein
MLGIRTLVRLDAEKYSDLVRIIETATDAEITSALNRNIKKFSENALKNIGQNTGHIIRIEGDGSLIRFDRADEAHKFAVALHHLTVRENLARPEQSKIWFRIGCATGEIDLNTNDGYLNAIAFRLEPKAQPGGILIDSQMYNDLSPELKIQYGAEKIIEGKYDEIFYVHRWVGILNSEKVSFSEHSDDSSFKQGEVLEWSKKHKSVIAIFVLLCAGGILFSRLSNLNILGLNPLSLLQKHEKWLPYKSRHEGINLKRPDSWQLIEQEDPISGEIFTLVAPGGNKNSDEMEIEKIVFIVRRQQNLISKEDYENIQIEKIRNSDTKVNIIPYVNGSGIFKTIKPTLSGYDAGVLEYSRISDSGEMRIVEVYVLRNNLAYSVFYQFNTRDRKNIQIFRELIDSVVIVEQN